MTETTRLRPIVFVWDNFGAGHADRAEAVALASPHPVVGIELAATSADYDWTSESRPTFEKITLHQQGQSDLRTAWPLIRTLMRLRPEAVFFCHYERSEIMVAAAWCRLAGMRVLAMSDSKFDDYHREMGREFIKRLFYLPYHGALAAGYRTADYLRFLGVPEHRIALGYDAVSVDRIRQSAGAPPAPDGIPFEDRHFTIIARLIPKKNLPLALKAFALARKSGVDRRLVLCGSGILETSLRAMAADLGIADHVDFRGFVDSVAIARTLATSLALLLPSTEEQFGQAIAEAIVMGVPVLVSDNCGARDTLVRSAVNGFVFEADNAEGLAWAMIRIGLDEPTWARLSLGCRNFVAQAGLGPFVEGCSALMARPESIPTVSRAVVPDDAQPAPIALFAYKRAEHTRRALEHLSLCPEYAATRVYVFIDGPKRETDREAVAQTRAVVDAFRTPMMTVVAQETNRGLAASIIAGVGQLCRDHGRAIVIEDDLVVHPTTLTWLNRGLSTYADDHRVMQIGAYQYRVPEFAHRPEGVFQSFATTWGWATWKRAWDLFDPEAKGWESIQTPGPARLSFDAGGVYPFSDMLVKQMTGRIDSWGIRWSWTMHRMGGLTLLPPRTLVRNEGFEDGATHNSIGVLKRFAAGPRPLVWDRSDPPAHPARVAVQPWEQAAFRRGLRRTGALRNDRIKRVLAALGFERFR